MPCNNNKKKRAEVAIFIWDKVDFKTKIFPRDNIL